MYLTYTICSHYHNTTEVSFCVPYLHNMLPLSYYKKGSILCTYLHNMRELSQYYRCSILCVLPTQYAPNIIILLRLHIVWLTYQICSDYHNTTKVAYCVPYLHNMFPISLYYQGSILCALTTQYAPFIIILLGSKLCTLPTQYASNIIILLR